MNCLVLDAMGVIFKSADDVGELLIPFIVEQGGSRDETLIQSAYLAASLGEIDAAGFWSQVRVSPQLEDEYLERHSLNPGVIDLLTQARQVNVPVCCLSNDLASWSKKLRARLGVEVLLEKSVISSDLGVRKPDAGIYQAFLEACGYAADELLFVDDRRKNVDAARALGIESLLFDADCGFAEASRWLSSHS